MFLCCVISKWYKYVFYFIYITDYRLKTNRLMLHIQFNWFKSVYLTYWKLVTCNMTQKLKVDLLSESESRLFRLSFSQHNGNQSFFVKWVFCKQLSRFNLLLVWQLFSVTGTLCGWKKMTKLKLIERVCGVKDIYGFSLTNSSVVKYSAFI